MRRKCSHRSTLSLYFVHIMCEPISSHLLLQIVHAVAVQFVPLVPEPIGSRLRCWVVHMGRCRPCTGCVCGRAETVSGGAGCAVFVGCSHDDSCCLQYADGVLHTAMGHIAYFSPSQQSVLAARDDRRMVSLLTQRHPTPDWQSGAQRDADDDVVPSSQVHVSLNPPNKHTTDNTP